jgi:hypothetical protein
VVLIAAVLLAIWIGGTRGSAMPPVTPMGDQPTYSLADPVTTVLLEPVLHAPWLGSAHVAGAVAVACAILFAGMAASIGAGASTGAAVVALVLVALDPAAAGVFGHLGWTSTALGWLWLAALIAFSRDVPGERSWARPLVATAVWTCSVWWSWVAVLAWPMIAVAWQRVPTIPVRAGGMLGAAAAGTIAVAAHFAAMAGAAEAASFAPGVSFTWREAIEVAFGARLDAPAGSFAAPGLATGLPLLATTLTGLGVVVGTFPRGFRRALVVSAVLSVAVAATWPVWRAELWRVWTWGLLPLSGIGLTWLARRAPAPRLAPAVVVVLGVVAVAETVVAGTRPRTGRDPATFRDWFERQLAALADEPLVIVAEDTRVDSALAAWLAGRSGVRRAPAGREAVLSAAGERRTVLAGWGPRRELELAGVRLATRVELADPAPYVLSGVDAVYRCAVVQSDRWSLLAGLEYTGRLGVEVPPHVGGEMHVIVGDILAPAVRASTPDGRPFPAIVEPLLTGPGASPPPADYWFDTGAPERAPPRVVLLRLAAHPAARRLVGLHLGRRSPRVLARLTGYQADSRGRVCAAPLGPDLLTAGQRSATVPLAQGEWFGTGWYGLERDGATPFRWADRDVVVLVPSGLRAAADVEIDASPASGGDPPPTITLFVNDAPLETWTMIPGARRYQWSAEAGVWIAGVNELRFHVSRAERPSDRGSADTRSLAMSVRSIAVTAR